MRKSLHQGEVVMPTCPECGAEGVPIVYGMPGSELIAEEEAGRVVLGGCVIEEEGPTWACKGPDQHCDLGRADVLGVRAKRCRCGRAAAT